MEGLLGREGEKATYHAGQRGRHAETRHGFDGDHMGTPPRFAKPFSVGPLVSKAFSVASSQLSSNSNFLLHFCSFSAISLVMNFLGSMRRGNRNNNNGGGDEGSKKKTGSVSLPSAPSSPSASTARHPQSNAGYASSSSSLVSGNSERSSSHSGNPMYGVGDGNDREISRATPYVATAHRSTSQG